jgi:hypothetical protein
VKGGDLHLRGANPPALNLPTGTRYRRMQRGKLTTPTQSTMVVVLFLLSRLQSSTVMLVSEMEGKMTCKQCGKTIEKVVFYTDSRGVVLKCCSFYCARVERLLDSTIPVVRETIAQFVCN